MGSLGKIEPKISCEQQIERVVAKFIKEKTGKGPDTTVVRLTPDVLICYYGGFMTKAEELIVESGNPEKISEYRRKYIVQCVVELEQVLKPILQRKITHFFPSWIPEQNLACWTIFLG